MSIPDIDPNAIRAALTRIAELEAENAQLKTELAPDISDAALNLLSTQAHDQAEQIVDLKAELIRLLREVGTAAEVVTALYAERDRLKAALAEEREACAQVADACSSYQAVEINGKTYALGSMAKDPVAAQKATSEAIAAAIRARAALSDPSGE